MIRTLLSPILCGLLLASGLAAQKLKVLDLSRLGHESYLRMQAAVPQIALVEGDRSKVAAQLADADGVIGPFDLKLLSGAPRLKWIQSESAGVENFTFLPGFAQSKIVLTNNKILQGPEIADHALGLLLALTRGIAIAARGGSEDWNQRNFHPIELRGKTAVIVGMGGIGTQIALRLNASGMTVIGVDPKDMPFNTYVSRMVAPDRLDSVLPQADVVFLSAPLTPQSRNMMGPREFELMKQDSYFIAVSRGGLYDTDALVKALDSRKLSGAGLDVTNPEPLPKGHALWKFPNVLITPHIAGRSDGENARYEALYIENLKRFAAGEPLLNVVDKEKGY
ncbi:MAG TPA: D-2-hydroxyacid dehydrogenase [Candidatus Acidoferrales bacterium]|nr:D-2-hydroxyacid dehydrogenase [Candidatus Acidoferrales bacterium]